MSNIRYPHFPKTRSEEVLHGVLISNEFSELENTESELTKKFVREQNYLTESILKTSLIREKFKKSLTSLMDYPKSGLIFV